MHLQSYFIILCLFSSVVKSQPSQSIFENIGLGQAPSGVYIPQDSFLNVLKNGPPSHSSVSYVPEQQYFAPLPFFQNTPAMIPSVQSNTVVEPGVHYVPENSETEIPASRNNRRQRQRARPSSQPELVVDIDVVSQQTPQPNKNTELDPSSEVITESETPKSQRPRRRKYRRIFREGTGVTTNQQPNKQTTIDPPRSIFENIGLGQAPSGVHIPQDSLLNVLNNGPPSHSSISYVPEQQYFVQPPTFFQNTPAVVPSVESSTVVEPGVDYVPENSETKIPASRNNRRQRQRGRPSSRSEPVVDIDVLRTPPDMSMSNPPEPFQGTRTQGRSVSISKSPLLIDNYQGITQPTQNYAPSAFQNIGLGEPPQGVVIPADSLLNVLKNTLPPSAYVAPIPNQQPAQISPEPQEHELSPVEMPSPNCRRQRSGQCSRMSTRQPEYRSDDQSQDMKLPEVRPHQPRTSGSRRTSRRRTEVRSAPPTDTVSRTEPQRITVSRTANRNRAERRQTIDNRRFKAAKLAIATLPEDEAAAEEDEAGINHPRNSF